MMALGGFPLDRKPVGWVEPFAKPISFAKAIWHLQLMGIAALHPSYALEAAEGPRPISSV